MKRVERIHVMMRYINNRAQFTITEMMQEFNVSRSTVIRDIREMEAMGMPLIAEVGRNGGYAVMQNDALPSVQFTDNEVKALFMAFMATRNQQLPYLRSRQTLAEKLLGLISETQQDELVHLNQTLLFAGTNPSNPDLLDLSDLPRPMLEKLIRHLLLDDCLYITIRQKDGIQSYPIYLVHLYHEKGTWLMEAFDLKEERVQLLPVVQLVDVEPYITKERISRTQMIKRLDRHKTFNLVLELGPKAISQFKKYHPINTFISYMDPYQTTARLETYADTADQEALTDMANWLLFLGEDIHVKQIPEKVSEVIRKKRQYLSGF